MLHNVECFLQTFHPQRLRVECKQSILDSSFLVPYGADGDSCLRELDYCWEGATVSPENLKGHAGTTHFLYFTFFSDLPKTGASTITKEI